MSQKRNLAETRTLTPAQMAVALRLVTEMDFLRLKAIARLYARGLPADIGWDDLLQEAFTRVIVGTRRPPDGLPMVAFIAGIVRSLRSDYWRRAQRRSREALALEHSTENREMAVVDGASDPERALSARQQLRAIERLFEDDAVALQIIACLSRGLEPDQICARLGISRTDYDSARKRMRRKLLREGLTCVE